MSVSLEVVQKELSKVEKKRKATETLRKEANDSLEKLKQTELGLQYQEIAIRSLTVPPAGRTAAAQQLSAVMGIPYNEPTIMELVNRYEKQDVVDEVSVVPEKPARVKKEVVTVETDDDGTDVPAVAPKRRGRPAMTPEQKAEAARQRAMAAQVKQNAAASPAAPVVEEEVDSDDDEYFDPSDYDDE